MPLPGTGVTPQVKLIRRQTEAVVDTLTPLDAELFAYTNPAGECIGIGIGDGSTLGGVKMATKAQATPSAAGLMSAADKTKLNGIATGATATTIVDNLNSTVGTFALSANQGRALDLAKLDASDVVDNLTSTVGTSALSANQGRVLNLAQTAAALVDSNARAALAEPNLIVNGGMEVSQENLLVPAATSGYYPADNVRYDFSATGTGAITVQQWTDAPAGYSACVAVETTTADTLLDAGEYFALRVAIEGNKLKGLKWAATGARAVKLRFWAKSTLTGTFSGSVYHNSGTARSFPFTYTISAANTWEQKTVSILADTAFAPSTAEGAYGMLVFFSLGSGSTSAGTAGAWDSSVKTAVTGSVNLVGTLNATLRLTGVDLYADDYGIDRPFPHKTYPEYLRECQRYWWKTSLGSGTQYFLGMYANTNQLQGVIYHPVRMAKNTTAVGMSGSIYTENASGTAFDAVSAVTASPASEQQTTILATVATSDHTARTIGRVYANSATAYLYFDSRL